jgi:hypothetical protein
VTLDMALWFFGGITAAVYDHVSHGVLISRDHEVPYVQCPYRYRFGCAPVPHNKHATNVGIDHIQ